MKKHIKIFFVFSSASVEKI